MITALRSSGPASSMRRQTAPSISLKITPELPRAPSRAPRLQASSAACRSASAGVPPEAVPMASRKDSRAAETVR